MEAHEKDDSSLDVEQAGYRCRDVSEQSVVKVEQPAVRKGDSPNIQRLSIVVPVNCAPEKWITFAAKSFPQLQTWSKAKRERKSGRLFLNGTRADPNELVKSGDVIELLVCSTKSQKERVAQSRVIFEASKVDINVVFESDDYAVVTKPGSRPAISELDYD